MEKTSYLNDNQIKVTVMTRNGKTLDAEALWMKVYLRCGGKTMTAVSDPTGEETKNCHVENGLLVLDIPGGRLAPGQPEYMVEVRQRSKDFEQGYKRTFSREYTKIEDIELV